MTAYYNEIDPHAAAWLRSLMAKGLIASGDVDERSIEDVCPYDLTGYAQHHFFAGLGGWSYALRLADWPDDRPIWTGSCPCQPFSAAGKGAGFADERHLWPAFFHLIRECRPERVVGEQVASNLAWLDLVQGDLEGEGYAVGATVVGAHSVGAPHIRQRLYWMADSAQRGRREERANAGGQLARERAQGRAAGLEQRRDAGDGLADQQSDRRDRWDTAAQSGPAQGESERQSVGSGLAHDNAAGRRLERRGSLLDGERPTLGHDADGRGAECDGLGHHHHQGLEGWSLRGSGRAGECTPWETSVLVACADGRLRPIPTEPALFPLAYGVSGRVGRLRAIGNAVVPQAAAEFIRAMP